LIGQATADIRRLVHDLRPPVLDQLGLIPTLQQHVERFGREAALTVHFAVEPALAIPGAAESTILRVVQEALVNVAKHAQASQVDVALGREGEWLTLLIRDNGVGLASQRGGNEPGTAAGTGLTSMRERAELLGGRLRITSYAKAGTSITLHLPLARPASERGRQETAPGAQLLSQTAVV
jgi:signal transduction histidine kinase